jgi:hypothetical protein
MSYKACGWMPEFPDTAAGARAFLYEATTIKAKAIREAEATQDPQVPGVWCLDLTVDGVDGRVIVYDLGKQRPPDFEVEWTLEELS